MSDHSDQICPLTPYAFTRGMSLPTELLEEVASYLTHKDIRAACQVCSHWNSAFARRLYTDPLLRETDSFHLFTETLLARPDLGGHVKRLDLSRVAGTAQTTRVADLLLLCPSLRSFRVPQAPITSSLCHSLATLSHLHHLDLEFCTDRFELSRVLNAAPNLCSLEFSRCAVSSTYPITVPLSELREIHLRGGVREDFLRRLAGLNLPLHTVAVSHLPSLEPPSLWHFMATLHGLTHFSMTWPMPRFSGTDADAVLMYSPALRFLQVSLDYIGARFFEVPGPALESLEFVYSGVGRRNIVDGDDITDALENQAHYPSLKRLGFSRRANEALFREHGMWVDLQNAAMARGITLYLIEHGAGSIGI